MWVLFFLVLYGLLFFRLEIIRVFNADTLRNHPQNTREITLVFDEPRGFIRTADGEVIAHTVAVSGRQGRFEAVSIWTSVFTCLRLHFCRERRIGSGTNPERLPWGKDLGFAFKTTASAY